MDVRRCVSLVVLVTFLPLALGCSSSRTVAIGQDPDSLLERSDEQRIVGYTTADGEHHSWLGLIESVAGDSLRFTPAPLSGIPEEEWPPPFRMARADVRSVDIGDDSGAFVALLVISGVLLAVVAVSALVANGIEEGLRQ